MPDRLTNQYRATGDGSMSTAPPPDRATCVPGIAEGVDLPPLSRIQ